MKTNCIMCPLGCELEIKQFKSGEIKVFGHTCPRGEKYGREEISCPMRTISTLVRVGEKVGPVKTSAPIPKDKIEEVLEVISRINLKAEPEFGMVVVENILNLGVNIVSIGF